MFRKRISACYDGLTPGHRKLADFILNHPVDVAGMTAKELAHLVGVEPGTATRFAQEIGYEGYRELMQDIRHYVREQATSPYQAGAAQTDRQRLANIQANTLQAAQHLMTDEMNSMEAALTALEAASHIWVLGDFVAYEIARIFVKQMGCINKPATLVAPTLTEMATALVQMQPGQALLVIGFGHAVMDIGYMVRLAREKGLTTLCLANNAALLPAREADIMIRTSFSQSVGPMSFVAPLLALNWLWEAMMVKNPEQMAQIFTTMLSEIGQLREWRKEIVET